MLLLLGAAAQDQLGGDLRAGSEGTDTDIGARQFLGDHAHRDLRQAHAAVLLGNRQAEDAELGHLGDDLHRDIGVLAVPLVSMWHDLGKAEAAHFGADRFHVLVEAGLADGGRAAVVADAGHEGGAVLGGVAFGDQGLHRLGTELGDLARAQAEGAGGSHHLALAHRDAGEHLVEVLAEADPDQEALGLAELPALRQALRRRPRAHARPRRRLRSRRGRAWRAAASPSSRPRSCPRPTGSWCARAASPRRQDPSRPRPHRGPASRDPAVRSRRRARLTW